MGGGIGLIACRFELRIRQRRGGRSGELDQRDDEREEPETQGVESHGQGVYVGSGDNTSRARRGTIRRATPPQGFRPQIGTRWPPGGRTVILSSMQRSLTQRILAGVIGLWMTITVSGVSLQACPEHGGAWLGGMTAAGMHQHGAADMGAGMAAAMLADMGGATGVGQHGQGQGAQGGGHSGHHGHQCTCPGVCCTTGLVSVPAGRLVEIPVVPVVVAAAAPLVYRDVAPRAAPDVVFPPPLGPPAQSV